MKMHNFQQELSAIYIPVIQSTSHLILLPKVDIIRLSYTIDTKENLKDFFN